VRLRPYRTVDDKIDGVVITFVDITDRKAWETRQAMLLGELTHRVKNTLTVVQSIGHQTLRHAASPEEFVAQFDGRLSALARAHGLLVQSDWRGADLSALIREQLEAYIAENPNRLRVEGERVILPADLATPFGLVLHELATNAAKHGSLSVPKGRISLSWSNQRRNDQRWLKFTWKELDGPRVTPPDRSGFGSSLIEKGIPEAVVKREYLPTGLVCTIEIAITDPSNGSIEQRS
jgi:two-component system CheB/CheR fusion protein